MIGAVAAIIAIPTALFAQMGGAVNPGVHVGGEPKHLIEVLFVVVPADAGADIILHAERCLMLPEGKAAERSTRPASGTSQAGSSSAASGRNGASTDMADERCFLLRADEVTLVVQPLGPRAFLGEHA